MKRKCTFLMAVFALLAFLAFPMGMRGQTRESYSVTYDYSDLGDMLYGSYLDASSYWKVPASSNNSATISIPITNQPESDITVSFHIATFGSGNNPTAYGTTITAVGTETGSNWSGSGLSNYPSSSTYVDGVMTIAKPQDPTSLAGLTITMGVNTGFKIFRLQSITISYIYSSGDTPPAPTYTVTFDAGEGTFVGNTDFPSESNTKAAGTYTLPSATRSGYTFDGWMLTGSTAPITGTYTVSGSVDFTASYTQNGGGTGGDEQWVLTPLADLTSNDVFVIVGNNGSDYAMSNDHGTSSSPAAVAVTVENGAITSTVAANIQWTVSGNASDGYTFYPNGSTTTWLYCNTTANSSSNNNMRVGTGNRKVFELNSNYYLVTKDTYTKRYLSIYNDQDWRGYVNTTLSPAISFYKKVTGGTVLPSITANNVEIACDATSGTITYTINHPVEDGILSATTTDNWLTLGEVGTTVPFTCTANQGEARTATVTLTYTYGDNETVTKEVTVTQAAYVAPVLDYATLPFAFDGGHADIANTSGLTHEGLASDYSGSPKLKFDGSGDWMILYFNETPGILTFDIKGNPGSGDWSGTFKVQTSEDGVTYSDLETYTALSTTKQSEEFNDLGENVRYIKWIFTEKDNGNVALGNITLAQLDNTPSITVANANVEVDAGEHDGTLSLTYNNLEISGMEDFGVQFYNADGVALNEENKPDWIEVVVAEEEYGTVGYLVSYGVEANEGGTRTAYFKVSAPDGNAGIVYSNLVTVNQSAYVAPPSGDGFVLFTGDLEEGDYVIYYEGSAMKNTVSSDRLSYENVTPINDIITTEDASIMWHIAPSGAYWTIYSIDADAYAASTGEKNKAQLLADGTDDKALWTVSGTETYEFVNKANAAAGVNANLRNNHNATNNYGFACYNTSTGGALSLYKSNSTTPCIVINPTAVDLAYDATSGAFGYNITNPVEGTSLNVSTNDSWISGIQVGADQVTFMTTVNNTGLERRGTILLTYEGAINKRVIVTQACLLPVITISNAPASAFPYEGGSGSFDFSIANEIEGGALNAFYPNWITDFEVSDNTVTFEVVENLGDERTGTITLAYRNMGEDLATAIININQEANPQPMQLGTFENPYTVPQAISIIPSSGTTDFVYVQGVVSELDRDQDVIQYHNITYFISDDGRASSLQLEAYRGKNLDNSDFMSIDELQLGDRVIIYGKLKQYGSIYEFDAYNYLVSLEREIEPPLFSPESCMLAKDDNAFVYIFSDTYDAEIHYTLDGNEPDRNSPEFNEEDPINLMESTGTVTIKAIAYQGEQSGAYQGKHSAINEAVYTLVEPGSPGLMDTPYTVQQALDALDANTNIDGVYVRGVICADPEIDENYHNAKYYIADDINAPDSARLYVKYGRGLNGEPMMTDDYILKGDIVTVYGNLTSKTQKMMDKYSIIYEWERPSSIIVKQNVQPESSPYELNVDCNEISFDLDVSYNNVNLANDNRPEVRLYDDEQCITPITCDWLTASFAQNNVWKLDLHISAINDATITTRTVYLKVVGKEYGTGNVLESNRFTITQNECQDDDFAILPAEYIGDEETIPQGFSCYGLGDVYDESPYLKLDSENDFVQLKFNEAPGILTFDIKSDYFKSGLFYLQTSTNGVSWDDVAIYTSALIIQGWEEGDPRIEIAKVLSGTLNEEFDELGEDVRYIRWYYKTYSSGRVRLGNIHLYKPVIYYDIVLNQPQYEDCSIAANKTRAEEGEPVTLTATVTDDYYFVEWIVTDENDNAVAVTNDVFVMPASDVTVSANIVPNDVQYQYSYSVYGMENEPQTVVVGETITLASGANLNEMFVFKGWTTDPDDVENVMRAGSSYQVIDDVTFYAVYAEFEEGSRNQYEKVTSDLGMNWPGDYLIVSEEKNVAFNGGLETLDAVGDTIPVNIIDGVIAPDNVVDAAIFTISTVDGGYSIKSASGKYIGRTSDTNGMNESGEVEYVNTITVDVESGNVDIVGNGGAYLRYNSASNQSRFRYFKSTTYSGQEAIQLYKFMGNEGGRYTRVFIDNPSGDIAIAGPSIIPSGVVLNVSSITNTLGADRLLIEEGAQLVTSNNIAATIRKAINPYNDDADNFYFISSPVNNVDPAAVGMTSNDFDLYYFDQDETDEEWQNYKMHTFNLTLGIGYLYANSNGGVISLAGTMTGGSIGNPNYVGWYLIGNPYPCNVTINQSYFRLAEGGTVLEETDSSIAIAPMEAVLVYVNEGQTIAFTKAPQTSTRGGVRSKSVFKVKEH